MESNPLFDVGLLTLSGTAQRLRIAQSWLKAEALAGKIPCTKVGTVLLFDPVAVAREIAVRAASERLQAQEVANA